MTNSKYFAFAAHNRVRETTDTLLLVRLLNHVQDRPVLQRLATDRPLQERLGRGWRFANQARLFVHKGLEHRFMSPERPQALPLPTIEEARESEVARSQANAVRLALQGIRQLLPMQHLGRLGADEFKRVVAPGTKPYPQKRPDLVEWDQRLEYGEMQQFLIEFVPPPDAKTVGVVRAQHCARMPDQSIVLLGQFDVVFVPGEIEPLAEVTLREEPLPEWANATKPLRSVGCGCVGHP